MYGTVWSDAGPMLAKFTLGRNMLSTCTLRSHQGANHDRNGLTLSMLMIETISRGSFDLSSVDFVKVVRLFPAEITKFCHNRQMLPNIQLNWIKSRILYIILL